MKWISIDNYEPNINYEAVLLRSDGYKQLATYLGEGYWGTARYPEGAWVGVYADSGLIDMIFPLPEPPKDEEGNF